MRFKVAASMIATHIFVEITEAMRLTRAETGACVVMERKAAEEIPACGQAPLGEPARVALHEVAPRAEGPAWVEAVCAVGAAWAAACVEAAVAACAAAAADIANSRDESHKTELELVHAHQNGDRDDLV
jgi:hypothetical protein